MSTTKWGVIAAVCVVAAILGFGADRYWGNGTPESTRDADTRDEQYQAQQTSDGEDRASGGETAVADADDSVATGGEATGGQATGGQATGGQATGGQATGGQATGGQATGGKAADAGRAVANATDEEVTAGGGTSGAITGSNGASAGRQSDSALEREAETYVEELVERSEEPVPMNEADTFVAANQPLVAGGGEPADRESRGSGAGSGDAGAGQGKPRAPGSGDGSTGPESGAEGAISAIPGLEAVEIRPVEEAARADDGDVGGVVPMEITETGAGTTAGEATDTGYGDDARQVTSGTGAGAQAEDETRVDLPLTEESPVTIAELLEPAEDIPPNAVFYVHTVKPDDEQGIWGIVHTGILENFAQGVAVRRGENVETYQVEIPRHADEREPDASSSFLGKLIHEKTRQSYVYNYQTERLGRNPDLIFPGQEIVIVSFRPRELIDIYKHFAGGGE